MKKNGIRPVLVTSCNTWRIALFLTILCVGAGIIKADSVRGSGWQAIDSGVTGTIYTLSGSSLDSLYFAENGTDTNIHKYNSTAGTWAADASWAAHFSGSSNWSAITSVNKVAVSGDKIYVMANALFNYVGYFDGMGWSDVSTGTTRTWVGMTADGTTMIAGSANDGRVTRVVDGETGVYQRIDTTIGISYTISIDGNNGVYWLRDNTSKVAVSSDEGVTWARTAADLPTSGVSGMDSIYSIDATHAIVSSASGTGTVYSTSDGGATWDLIGDEAFDSGGYVRGIYANGWDDIIAYGSFSGLWHWNGSDWAHIDLPDHSSAETLRTMTCVDGVYFVAGDDGVMYMSTIPEPATLGLLAAGGLLGLIKRRS